MKPSSLCTLTSSVTLALLLACGPGSNDLPLDPGLSITGHRSSQQWSPWSEPINLGPTINTPSGELDVALSKDGLSLYLVSDRAGRVGGNDIWVARRSDRDAPWSVPVNLGSTLNSGSNENTVALSRDGHWLFFGSGRPGGFGGSDVYASYREHVHDDFGWQAPINVGPGINTADVEFAGAYFENDDVGVPQLYFHRGRLPVPGGDLYVSQLTADGSWGLAVPVVDVNSSAAERGPSVDHDGLSLYFWSNRSEGAHIWVATRQSVLDPWSAPQRVDVSIAGSSEEVEPFIHSHGSTESLFMVGFASGNGNDVFVSERRRVGTAR